MVIVLKTIIFSVDDPDDFDEFDDRSVSSVFFTFVVGGSGEHKYDRSCPQLESSVHAMYCWMGKNVIRPLLHSFKTIFHIM